MITIGVEPKQLYPWQKRPDEKGRVFTGEKWVHICKKCKQEFPSRKALKRHKQGEHSY